MSVAVCVRVGEKWALAADSAYRVANLSVALQRSKIRRCCDWLVAAVGGGAASQWLYHRIATEKNWETDWPDLCASVDFRDPAAAIAVHGRRIYLLDTEGNCALVDKDERIVAIGTGAQIAAGAADALLAEGHDARVVAEGAVTAAIHRDLHCGGPVEIVEG